MELRIGCEAGDDHPALQSIGRFRLELAKRVILFVDPQPGRGDWVVFSFWYQIQNSCRASIDHGRSSRRNGIARSWRSEELVRRIDAARVSARIRHANHLAGNAAREINPQSGSIRRHTIPVVETDAHEVRLATDQLATRGLSGARERVR